MSAPKKIYSVLMILILVIAHFVIYFALQFLEDRARDEQKHLFLQKVAEIAYEIPNFADAEKFWAGLLYQDSIRAKNWRQFLSLVKSRRKQTGVSLPCIIWDSQGLVAYNNYFPKTSGNLQKQLFFDLQMLAKAGRRPGQSLEGRLRKFLGPQLSISRLHYYIGRPLEKFFRPDLAGNYDDFWFKIDKKFSVFVFFDRANFDESQGLQFFRRKFAKDGFRIKFHSLNQKKNISENFDEKLRLSQNLFKNMESVEFVSGNFVAFKRVYGQIMELSSPYRPIVEPGKFTWLLSLFCMLITILNRERFLDLLELNKFSIRWQLLLFLFFTTILPLLTLSIASTDYLLQKKENMTKNAYYACIDFLKHVDQRSIVNDAILLTRVDRAMEAIRGNLAKNWISPEICKIMRENIKMPFFDFRLVAASSAILLANDGYLKKNRLIKFTDIGRAKAGFQELSLFRDVATYYLAAKNSTQFDPKKLIGSELFCELFFQKKFHEVVSELLLAIDRIRFFGVAEKPYPVSVKLVSINDNAHTDFFFVQLFNKHLMQRDFLIRQSDNIKRNLQGLKFLFANDWSFSKFERPVRSNAWVMSILKGTLTHPSVEPRFTEISGKKHVFAGIRSQNLDDYYFFAFYPVEKIEAALAEDREFLFRAILMIVVMLTGFGLIFASAVILPLKNLQTAAVAISDRDFSFRLSEGKEDEFGQVARVFNSSMADFEELMLAGIVQKRLLPQTGLSGTGFEMFGKSIPMESLGGDYFDYFKIDENNYALLTGDVAGHGVGASLIMALAKGGVMCCREMLGDPASVLTELHRIITESRTKKQRKVMTLQYLVYNGENGDAVYSNAGACSPILVDFHSGTAEEVKLLAPVLGGFKNSTFSNINLKMAPGQALVFYTDGIIEAMNPHGVEIGYERFKKILIDCFDSDAEKFYLNVFDEYTKWLDGGKPQDDLTMVILLRKETGSGLVCLGERTAYLGPDFDSHSIL